MKSNLTSPDISSAFIGTVIRDHKAFVHSDAGSRLRTSNRPEDFCSLSRGDATQHQCTNKRTTEARDCEVTLHYWPSETLDCW